MKRWIIECRMDTGVWVCALPDDSHPALYDTEEQAARAAGAHYEIECMRGLVRIRKDPSMSYRVEQWVKHYRILEAQGRADTKRINFTVETALQQMRDSPEWEGWRQHQARLEWERRQVRKGMN